LPTQVTRSVISQLKPLTKPSTIIVICSKGFEHGKHNSATGAMLSEVVKQELPNQPIAVLSGPNFAIEVANGLPAATTIASADIELAKHLSTQLRHKYFRCYANDDMIGVQVCGALKNVMAIACGAAHGKKLGNNTVAALITRGLAEIRRLALHLGAKEKTLLGLAAIGDMLLTCTSEQSRNMSLGKALGEGQDLQEYLSKQKSITEGYYTAQAINELNKAWQVNMPICNVVYNVLHEGLHIDNGIAMLMEQHSELEFEA
jgi:glycerol-3-phosphate dehydrogenase (NAD(P)+)